MSETDRQREGDNTSGRMELVGFRITPDMADNIDRFVEFYPSRSALVRDAIRRHICHLKIEGNYPDADDCSADYNDDTVSAVRLPTEMQDHIDQYAAYYETKSALIRDAISSHLTHLQTSTHPDNGELPD